jgi:nucleoside-diphosphate-sugar epimerase
VLDGGIPGYVLRCGYLYGAGTLAMRELRDALQAGRGVASGTQPSAWLHEDDLAAAIVMLIEQSDEGEAVGTILNLAEETHITPDKFARLFAAALGVGEPAGIPGFLVSRRTTPAQRDALEAGFLVSSDKARAMGWKPHFVSPAEGIERTLLTWRAESAAEVEPEQLPERAIVTL